MAFISSLKLRLGIIVGILALLSFFMIVARAHAACNVPAGCTGQTSFGVGGWLYQGTDPLRLQASTSPTVGIITATSTTASSTLPRLNVSNQIAIGGSGTIFISSISGTQCLHVIGGLVSGTGSDCGSGGGSFSYPFPSNATSTVLTFSNGISTPNLTNLTSDGYVKTSGGNGTLSVQGVPIPVGDGGTGAVSFTAGSRFVISNGTSAFTSVAAPLTVSNGGTGSTTLSGILKGAGTGIVATAVPGTDYTLITANTCGAGNHVSAITALGVITCSPDTGSGGTGLSTTSPIANSNVLTYSTAGAGSAYGTATSSIGAGTGLTFSGTAGAQVGGTNGTYSVNTTQNILKLSGLTTNGFVQTSGGDGTLSSAALTSGNITTALGFTPTNYLTNSSANTFLNTGTNLQAPVLMATSTTATSTFAGDVAIGSTGLPNPYLFIGTSTAHVPLYGRVAGDIIDSEYDWNGVSSINIANANVGTCAASTYFADGNNPTLGGYYGTFSFLNDGWTNGGGAGCGIGASNTDKPEAVVIVSPTGEMDFDIASTTQTGATDFNWNVNNTTKLKLTNTGKLGVGTTTPSASVSVDANSTPTQPGLSLASQGTPYGSIASSTASSLLLGTTTPATGSATSTIYMQKLQFQGGNSAGSTDCAFVNASNAWTVITGPCL